jgi:hypothetical protein
VHGATIRFALRTQALARDAAEMPPRAGFALDSLSLEAR